MIRLNRAGTKNKPFYRVVVSDSQRTPGARVTAQIGYYDPKTKPEVIKIDVAKADAWIQKGAHTSETVRDLLARARQASA